MLTSQETRSKKMRLSQDFTTFLDLPFHWEGPHMELTARRNIHHYGTDPDNVPKQRGERIFALALIAFKD